MAEFLLLDDQFPRSVRRCLTECQSAAALRAGPEGGAAGNEADRKIADLVTWISRLTIGDVIRAGLHESITHIVDRLHEIGLAIHRTYFDVTLGTPVAEPDEGGQTPKRRAT